jgi:hypothetical protein
MSHHTLQWQRRFLKTWLILRREWEWYTSYLFYVKFCCSHVGWLADSYMFLRLRRKINIFRSACCILATVNVVQVYPLGEPHP